MRVRHARVPSALAAFVFVFANLLGMLHEATTAHVRCAAHGELVDTDRPAGVGVGPACSTIVSAQRSARGHGDVHCLVASALRESRIAPQSPVVVAAIAAVDHLAISPTARPVASVALLYRIAPKTSPPA